MLQTIIKNIRGERSMDENANIKLSFQMIMEIYWKHLQTESEYLEIKTTLDALHWGLYA